MRARTVAGRMALCAIVFSALSACGEKAEEKTPAEPMTQFNSPLLGEKAPELEQAAPTAVGALLESSDLTMSEGFVENGHFHDRGPPPVDGPTFGSQVPAGDTGTGVLTFVVKPAGAAAIVIPVLTGPSGTSVTFRVVNIADEKSIASLENAPGLGVWRLWRVALPEAARNGAVRIEVTDAGSGWGEWIAVGAPHAAN